MLNISEESARLYFSHSHQTIRIQLPKIAHALEYYVLKYIVIKSILNFI